MKLNKILVSLILMLVYTNALPQDADHNIVFQNLAWAPDENTIAFTVIKVKPDWSDYSPEKWSIFLYNLDNNQLKKVDSSGLYLSFSPDGKKLAFDKTVDNNANIYEYELNTGTTSMLIDHESKDRAPSWSPDGTSIVFYSDRDGNEELFKFDIESGELKQLTNRTEDKSYNPVWSPQSGLIVYYLEKGDNKDQIFLTDNNGAFQRNLTNDDHHNVFPSWTPDGRIIYIRDKGEIMIMDDDGSNKQQLTEYSAGQVRIGRDGQKLLMSKEENLVTIDLKTGKETIILKGDEIYR